MMATGKVSPTVQLHLVGFLCIILLFTSVAGPAGALRPTVTCIGSCDQFPDCNAACKARNHPNGGICMGPVKRTPACCCNVAS
ncbi:hypothetical protein D8674_003075 [Pyrus ussuriensis x Pyrus communis]|uniref:Uncharacterized protein n=1 Tax=Pyrus ussuriensis x Pyrus communis TaxID=2448454 RepID=A0A5N5FLA6_9ROSA|nr:hypothetical protein D8674_003075 [Pyrus ussuriensis x Pyrus communis]